MLNMSSFSLVCFFVFCSLPDSPAEPDPENQQGSSEEPKVIPHDEVCPDCKLLSVFAITYITKQKKRDEKRIQCKELNC